MAHRIGIYVPELEHAWLIVHINGTPCNHWTDEIKAPKVNMGAPIYETVPRSDDPPWLKETHSSDGMIAGKEAITIELELKCSNDLDYPLPPIPLHWHV